MRIPFPTRIPITGTIVFATALVCVEQIQHTKVIFSLLVFAFIVLTVITFNAAKGFYRATGAYVFSYALLTCFAGILWKSVLGEAAETNLRTPIVTMSAYVLSMVGMLLAVVASRALIAGRRTLSDRFTGGMDYGKAATGCLVAALIIIGANLIGSPALRQILQGINQLNLFFPLAIILGTRDAIKTSNGRRSMNLTVILAITISMFYGFVAFSKQGIFTPSVSWLFAAASVRFRFRTAHLIAGTIFLVVSTTILVPVIQVGKNGFDGVESFGERVALSAYLLTHRDFVQQTIASAVETRTQFAEFGYYNSDQGIFERFSIMPIDDQLISYTDSSPEHQFGLGPVRWAFENMIPHFILPNKEADAVGGGNFYVHEMGGGLSEEDQTTGISFSPAGEAFHLVSWYGIILLLPVLWTALFTIIDMVCGDTMSAPWALMASVAYLHVAPEGAVANTIYFLEFGNLGLIVAMVFCARLAPILGAFFSGAQRSVLVPVAHPARRLPPPASSLDPAH